MRVNDFDQRVAGAALDMADAATLSGMLETVLVVARDLMPNCDAALIMVNGREGPPVVATSDPALGAVVERHARAHAAPVSAVQESGERVYSADLAADDRWPAFARAIEAATGIRSVYGVPLARDHKRLGALVLYAKAPHAFDPDDRATAALVGVHATAALAGSLHREQLETALATRTVIGQATGIVMDRFGLDASAAFGVLRRLSQTQNRKLRSIADQIVRTGNVG